MSYQTAVEKELETQTIDQILKRDMDWLEAKTREGYFATMGSSALCHGRSIHSAIGQIQKVADVYQRDVSEKLDHILALSYSAGRDMAISRAKQMVDEGTDWRFFSTIIRYATEEGKHTQDPKQEEIDATVDAWTKRYVEKKSLHKQVDDLIKIYETIKQPISDEGYYVARADKDLEAYMSRMKKSSELEDSYQRTSIDLDLLPLFSLVDSVERDFLLIRPYIREKDFDKKIEEWKHSKEEHFFSVISTAARHYASKGDVESVVAALFDLEKIPADKSKERQYTLYHELEEVTYALVGDSVGRYRIRTQKRLADKIEEYKQKIEEIKKTSLDQFDPPLYHREPHGKTLAIWRAEDSYEYVKKQHQEYCQKYDLKSE